MKDQFKMFMSGPRLDTFHWRPKSGHFLRFQPETKHLCPLRRLNIHYREALDRLRNNV